MSRQAAPRPTERASHTLITVDVVASLLNGNVNEYVELPATVEGVSPEDTTWPEERDSVVEVERGENEEEKDTTTRAEAVDGGTSKTTSRVLSYLVSSD